jgi:ATP-dependent DNA helicase RecG
LEFKSAYDRSRGQPRRRQARLVARDIAEALCAFANADGGTLLVGVEDDKTVSGVPYPQERLEILTRTPETHCRPQVRAQSALVSYTNVPVLVFIVDSSPEAHGLTDGRTPLRVGDSTIPLPQQDVAALKRTRARTIFERQIIPDATLDDLDLDLLHEYAERVGEHDPVAALESQDLIQRFDGQVRVSMGALLLFGQLPLMRWHPRAGVEFLRFQGVERLSGRDYNLINRQSFNDLLPRLIRLVWDFLSTQIRQETRLHDLFFWERAEYPTFAWQEAVINAVAHRDYSIAGASIEISMFDDRIEVKSPGTLPELLTLEDIRARRNVHLSRNPRIVQVLKAFSLMQEVGEGIPRMYREMELSGLHPPEFDQNRLHFYATLRNTPVYDVETMRFLEGFRDYDLNDRQIRALAQAFQAGAFTRIRYQELNEVDSDMARREILALLDLGVVQQEGRGRGTRYVVAVPSTTLKDRLRSYLQEHGSISNRAYRELMELDSRQAAWKELSEMVAEGKLRRTGKGRGATYVPTSVFWV